MSGLIRSVGLLGYCIMAHPAGRLLLVGLTVINATMHGGTLHGLGVLLLAFSYEYLMWRRE